nr:MMPL family transporter [Staphylococcus simulans]
MKSIETNQKIEKEFKVDNEKAGIRVVLKSDDKKGIMKPEVMKDVQKTLNDIKKENKHVESVTDPYKYQQIIDSTCACFLACYCYWYLIRFSNGL